MANYVVQYAAATFYTPAKKKGDYVEHVVARGEEVPDGVDEAYLSVCISSGIIVPVDADAMEGRRVRARSGDAPAESATQAVWAEYAVSRGADEDEANASTKADLIARYGTR